MVKTLFPPRWSWTKALIIIWRLFTQWNSALDLKSKPKKMKHMLEVNDLFSQALLSLTSVAEEFSWITSVDFQRSQLVFTKNLLPRCSTGFSWVSQIAKDWLTLTSVCLMFKVYFLNLIEMNLVKSELYRLLCIWSVSFVIKSITHTLSSPRNHCFKFTHL